jgi:hypothetical protein
MQFDAQGLYGLADFPFREGLSSVGVGSSTLAEKGLDRLGSLEVCAMAAVSRGEICRANYGLFE